MPFRSSIRIGSSEKLAEIKAISGWAIERQRIRIRLNQEDLASRTSITSRWIREIEGGNPKSTLDDHLRCAAALDLSIGYLAFPMLYAERGASFPREFLMSDLTPAEDHCMDAVAQLLLGHLRQALDRGDRKS